MAETNIQCRDIFESTQEAYCTYAIDVILGRALPDIRDGLKPVMRRILYSMYESKCVKGKHYKCAKIVGDVMGEYHPHGTDAIYQSVVKAAQDFSINYPLIKGQGNFGSIDGDPAAAMRYTEAQLEDYALNFFKDFNKKTTPMIDNYDNSKKEPIYLSTPLPNLLINGTQGIAVGISTSIPPHNLEEVCLALIHLLEHSEATLEDILKIIKGPDLPRGGIISSRKKLCKIYANGNGVFHVRARSEIKDNNIIFSEIPYNQSKSEIMLKLSYYKNEAIIPIRSIRDETTKKVRIVITVPNGYDPKVVRNLIYRHTNLQCTIGTSWFVVDVDKSARIYNLMQYLHYFLEYRDNTLVVNCRNRLYNNKQQMAQKVGLLIALQNLDQIIEIIKNTSTTEETYEKIQNKSWKIPEILDLSVLDKENRNCKFSKVQIDNILSLKLSQLRKKEEKKLLKEITEYKEKITEDSKFLAKKQIRKNYLINELKEFIKKYAKSRKSEIIESEFSKNPLDVIDTKELIVIFDTIGYVKVIPVTSYKKQQAGGKGVGEQYKNLQYVIRTNSHDDILLFLDSGYVKVVSVYQLPQGDRRSRGKALVNYVNVTKTEQITNIIRRSEINNNTYILFIDRDGHARKNACSDFTKINRAGKRYSHSKTPVVAILLLKDKHYVIIATANGKLCKMLSTDFRCAKNRSSAGVKAIKLDGKKNHVIGAIAATENDRIVLVSTKARGKQINVSELPTYNRGAQGVFGFKCTRTTGRLAAILLVKSQNDDILLLTDSGQSIRMSMNDVPLYKRHASGNRLMKLAKDLQNNKINAAIMIHHDI